jgi:hypothetical protein
MILFLVSITTVEGHVKLSGSDATISLSNIKCGADLTNKRFTCTGLVHSTTRRPHIRGLHPLFIRIDRRRIYKSGCGAQHDPPGLKPRHERYVGRYIQGIGHGDVAVNLTPLPAPQG